MAEEMVRLSCNKFEQKRRPWEPRARLASWSVLTSDLIALTDFIIVILIKTLNCEL